MDIADYEWFQAKVCELRSDLGRTQVLSELKRAVDSQNLPQQKCIAQNLQLDEAFECLNYSDTEDIDSACHILSSLLGSLDPNIVLAQYLDHLKCALCHPLVVVKKMCITEFRRAACNSELIPHISQDDILVNVVTCLNSKDTALAKAASSLLVRLGEYPAALETLFSGYVLETLKSFLDESDIIRFRVFEMGVLIAAYSPEGLVLCETTGILQALIGELDSEDVVMQLNALELLTKLARRQHSLEWLHSNDILGMLAVKLASLEEEYVMENLLLPGLLKLFGVVAQNNPKNVFTDYPIVISVLLETFESSDIILLGIAMDTLGCIAKSVEGKYILYATGEQMKTAIRKMAYGIEYFPQLSRARALKAMADLIELKGKDQKVRALEITEYFFHCLSEDPVSLVMAVFQKQFPKLRLAGLHLLKVLAEQEWGLRLIGKQPGIIEFLLDHAIETYKYFKNGKFAVVKTILQSPIASFVFTPQTVTRLQKSIEDGSYFVQTKKDITTKRVS